MILLSLFIKSGVCVTDVGKRYLYCAYLCKTIGVLVIYVYVLPADTMETYLYILINNIFTAFLYKYSW